MTKLERPQQQTDGRTDKPKTIEIMSCSLGLLVDFFAMVARARACGVRACVRA